jgi:hypothetical protein
MQSNNRTYEANHRAKFVCVCVNNVLGPLNRASNEANRKGKWEAGSRSMMTTTVRLWTMGLRSGMAVVCLRSTVACSGLEDGRQHA